MRRKDKLNQNLKFFYKYIETNELVDIQSKMSLCLLKSQQKPKTLAQILGTTRDYKVNCDKCGGWQGKHQHCALSDSDIKFLKKNSPEFFI